MTWIFPAFELADAGDYTVTVSNRAGTTVSGVAALTVTASRPSGIYMGRFAGQGDNGGFAAMVSADGSVVAVGYNTVQEEGVYVPELTISDEGAFSGETVQGGQFTGTVTADALQGSLLASSSVPGTFSGQRKDDSGPHEALAGFYTGTYNGLFTGTAFAIVAADGEVFFYTIDNPTSPTADGDGGGFGMLNSASEFGGSTVPNGLIVLGTLNPQTRVLSGVYGSPGVVLGAFSLTRTAVP